MEIKYNQLLKNETTITQLGSMIEIQSGKRPKNIVKIKTDEFSYPVVGATKILGYTNDYICNDKTLIIGRVGTHGIIQRYNEPIWPSDNSFCIHTSYYEFIYQALKNIDYSKLNSGSTQPLITQSTLKKVEISIPKEDMLKKFENESKSISEYIHTLSRESEVLIKIRDSLISELIR